MGFEYIYGKQAEQYDYLYIPKAFMKEEPFKKMSSSAKILYAVLLEKQQDSMELGWIDEKNHVYIIVEAEKLANEINGAAADIISAMKELEQVGLLEMEEGLVSTKSNRKIYLKRFV